VAASVPTEISHTVSGRHRAALSSGPSGAGIAFDRPREARFVHHAARKPGRSWVLERHHMKRLFSSVLVGFLATACNAGNSTSSISTATTPTTPTATVMTETFSGTVDVAGRDVHGFTVTLSGSQVNVNLTAAGPPATIFMGLGVGSLASDGSCTLLTNGFVVTQASTTAQLAGTLNAGSYCVVVSDAGNQLAQVTYSVVVNHF
jgi:hypothetical protein